MDSFCQLSFDDGIEIKYEGKISQIQEFLNFGNKIPKASYILNPYLFERMLDYCEKFAFVSGDNDLLLGISKDSSFKALLSLEKV